MINTSAERVKQKIEDIKTDFGVQMVTLLHQTNQKFLQGKAQVNDTALIDRNNVRWTMTWQEGAVSYDLSVVVSIDDDGKRANVGKVWLHRHAASSLDFEGHTPTTRMRRLTNLSIKEIKEAIELEFK